MVDLDGSELEPELERKLAASPTAEAPNISGFDAERAALTVSSQFVSSQFVSSYHLGVWVLQPIQPLQSQLSHRGQHGN